MHLGCTQTPGRDTAWNPGAQTPRHGAMDDARADTPAQYYGQAGTPGYNAPYTPAETPAQTPGGTDFSHMAGEALCHAHRMRLYWPRLLDPMSSLRGWGLPSSCTGPMHMVNAWESYDGDYGCLCLPLRVKVMKRERGAYTPHAAGEKSSVKHEEPGELAKLRESSSKMG